jgi:hypothetical protein
MKSAQRVPWNEGLRLKLNDPEVDPSRDDIRTEAFCFDHTPLPDPCH